MGVSGEGPNGILVFCLGQGDVVDLYPIKVRIREVLLKLESLLLEVGPV